jgi:hypothetical protein
MTSAEEGGGMNEADRSQEIERLCDAWVAAATPASGGLQIGEGAERYRLLANGIAFHDLTYAELRAACLGLARVLLRPGLNTVIDFDHMLFWAWSAEIFAGSAATYFDDAERESKELFGLACRAALAGTYRPDDQGWKENRDPRPRYGGERAGTSRTFTRHPCVSGLSAARSDPPEDVLGVRESGRERAKRVRRAKWTRRPTNVCGGSAAM